MSVFWQGMLASTIAGLLTGLGGFLIFMKKKYSRGDINVLLNIAAGVMLAASFFSLLSPAMDQIVKICDDIHVAGFWFAFSVFLGVALVWILNALLPHEHNCAGHHGLHFKLKTAWLFIIAITLHKIPEGLAVGVAYGAESLTSPESLVIGIALHNIPEGLTIAISLVGAGVYRLKAASTALLIGFMQPIGAIIGLLTMDVNSQIVPFGMALAGGTLLFVVINEILPETYEAKNSKKASVSLFLGFIFMTYLTIVLD